MGLFSTPDPTKTAADKRAGRGKDVLTPEELAKTMGGKAGTGRINVNNAPLIGTAQTREEYAQAQKDALIPSPPPTDPNRIGDARAAAERQRKRATSGSGLTGSGMKPGGPGARLTPAALIGGY
jgi:hypothetical protein